MSYHSSDCATILLHYLFYLIFVGLLSLSVTYLLDSDQNNGVKSSLQETVSLILKKAEYSR